MPEVRFGGHLQEALSSRERTRKNARILEILDAGLKPEVVILQEVPPGLLGIYEARWIYLYATGEFGGPGILNVTRPRLDADSAAFLLSFIHERVRLIDEHLAELRGGAVQ